MACTYVKEFDFSKTAGDMSAAKSGYCEGGMAKKSGYARGGKVAEKATGEVYPSREAMMKHESKETPRMQREEIMERAKVVAPVRRRSVPVAPVAPLLAMKKGGPVPKAGAYKVGKVMGEFGKGELHSGSKSGPVVSNPKQAVAIALSEARQAAKKR